MQCSLVQRIDDVPVLGVPVLLRVRPVDHELGRGRIQRTLDGLERSPQVLAEFSDRLGVLEKAARTERLHKPRGDIISETDGESWNIE